MRRYGAGEGSAVDIPYYLQRPAPEQVVVGSNPDEWRPYNPNIALAPPGSIPYYLEAPTGPGLGALLSEYKWWLIGGGAGLFLLAGGSILGLSLRKKRKGRR